MNRDKQFMAVKNGNDVRGVVMESEKEAITLTEEMVRDIAGAFCRYVARQMGKGPGQLRIGLGHDSRLSAEKMKRAVLQGAGEAVIFDCGLITTPAMFQSTLLPESSFDAAIMLTASHLPAHRNGMKFFTAEGPLDGGALKGILEDAAANPVEGSEASGEPFPMAEVYSAHMRELIRREVGSGEKPLAGLHLLVDAGNGAAGFFATEILEPLGACIAGSQFLEPDGSFPNHIPNPEDEKAMEAVCLATRQAGADLGIIFDCDGDRGAVVFSDGREVNRNRLIALLAALVAEEAPGSTIVTDSVTSDELTLFLEGKLRLKHLRYKRGYKNVIDKGIACNAAGERCELAVETSGHGAFRENHFSDDGAYIAVKILCYMARLRAEGKSLESLLTGLQEPKEEKELRFRIEREDFSAYGDQVLADFQKYAEEQEGFQLVQPNYEGVRVSFDDEELKGWLLLRKSLHDPVLPMNLAAGERGSVEAIWRRTEAFFKRHDALQLQ